MLLTEIFALSALSGVLAAPPLARESFATQLDNTTVPANFTPTGGVDVSPDSPPPIYHTASDFDFQSLNLALNQEYIELDLFHHGLAQFSVEEFEAAGLNADDRFLIEFMADQEVGHAELLSSILGRTCIFYCGSCIIYIPRAARAAKICTYSYPFKTVRQFVDFCQKLTRFGESGVYGFLSHLDSRPSATLLTQTISTEARQQMIFRQFAGAFPMPVWFETVSTAFGLTMDYG